MQRDTCLRIASLKVIEAYGEGAEIDISYKIQQNLYWMKLQNVIKQSNIKSFKRKNGEDLEEL